MSRYGDFYYGEPNYDNSYELWASNVARAIKGKRGRKALTTLRDSLLALPNKRLITDKVSDGQDVCAIGAYLVGKGYSIDDLPQQEEPLEDTAYLASRNGMTYTLAWELAYRNDETYGRQTPEQRYNTFLNWLNKQLESEATA